MYFPSSLCKAIHDETPEDLILNNRNNNIPFTMKFRYLGSIITPKLNENAEIEPRIKKASSQMGILKHFFSSKDIDPQVKYWVYLTGPLNCLLWGCKSWNVMKRKQRKTQKLSSLSHQKNSWNHLDQSKRRKNHKQRSQILLPPNPRHGCLHHTMHSKIQRKNLQIQRQNDPEETTRSLDPMSPQNRQTTILMQ